MEWNTFEIRTDVLQYKHGECEQEEIKIKMAALKLSDTKRTQKRIFKVYILSTEPISNFTNFNQHKLKK